MQNSGSEGAIIVSFGTILGNIDEKLLALLADAFSRVPYQVIWKLHRGKAFGCVLYALFSQSVSQAERQSVRQPASQSSTQSGREAVN